MDELETKSVSLLIKKARTGCDRSKTDLICQLESYMQLMADRNTASHMERKFGKSDIVQQSMVCALKGFGDFRGSTQGELKAWVKQIVQNEIRRNVRDLSRDKRDVSRERSMDNSRNGIRRSIVDVEPTPQTTALESERVKLMHDAIELLPENYRTVVELRGIQRLTIEEVAQKMGRSEEATKKLWYRAIIKLQQNLKHCP